jgi:hypothetical protein
MAFALQAGLVRTIAETVEDYRAGSPALVKFAMECGIALNRQPIISKVTVKPTMRDERFQIGDETYRGKFASDRDAFFAAFDAFMANGQFLAWNGRAPVARGVPPMKALSENFAHPTFQIDMTSRRRGEPKEIRYAMLFVGFRDDDAAKAYADRLAHLVM